VGGLEPPVDSVANYAAMGRKSFAFSKGEYAAALASKIVIAAIV
jgi:hypothetical protein